MIPLDNDKIKQICKKHGVSTLYLVGSSARDDHTSNSDIDFLVTFNHIGRALDQYFDTLEELQNAAGKHVDLIEESAIKSEQFKQSIAADRILLYEA